MSSLGTSLRSAGVVVSSDNPVYGRPASVAWDRPRFIVVHHFVGSEKPSDIMYQVGFLKTGKDYPPNSQLYLDVLGGTHIISKERPGQAEPGRATHMGSGAYPGIRDDRGNEVCLGIECQNDGSHPLRDQDRLYPALLKLLAALVRHYNLPVSAIIGHKEYNPGKVDPRDSMDDIRRDVTRVIAADKPSRDDERLPVRPVVATWNLPHRIGPAVMVADLRGLRDKHGVTLIATQENTDRDVEFYGKQLGWDWYRPDRAQSAGLLFDPDVWEPVYRDDGKRRQGAYRLHTPGVKVPARYIVWAALKYKPTGKVYRVGSAHLIAFKTSRPKHAKEFLRQQGRAARWLRGGSRRVLMGDLNSDRSLFWTPALVRDAVWETPRLVTKDRRKKIDHVLRPKGRRAPRSVRTVEGNSDHRALIVRL